jgi:hypothetical protein
MKTTFTISRMVALMLLLSTFGFIQKSQACIDPDTVITVICNYSPDFTQVEIRLGNLKLHTETPNTFCSCALSSWYDAFTNPTYIAFVYKGTNNPYPNFAAWDNTSGADNAWNTEFPNYPNWSGYISAVVNQGLSTNDEVEMVIRASTPPGTFAIVEHLDSAMASITLGTDMWLPDEQTMAFDHPGIRNIKYDNSSFLYFVKPLSYFEELDAAILLSGTSNAKNFSFDINLGPNPMLGNLNVYLNLTQANHLKMRLLDINGTVISNKLYETLLPPGEHHIQLDLLAILPKNGIYLLEVQSGEAIQAKRFLRL